MCAHLERRAPGTIGQEMVTSKLEWNTEQTEISRQGLWYEQDAPWNKLNRHRYTDLKNYGYAMQVTHSTSSNIC